MKRIYVLTALALAAALVATGAPTFAQAAADGAPPLRLAAKAGAQPLASLRPATEAAAPQIEAIGLYNRSGQVPAQNGFARALVGNQRIQFSNGLLRRTLSPGVDLAHQGGLFSRSAAGEAVWGTEVRVDGAFRTRLHLADVDLPPGSRIWVYGGDDEVVGPFGLELRNDRGGIWTPSIGGEAIRLEVAMPGAAQGEFGFRIDQVMEIFELDRSGTPIDPLTRALPNTKMDPCPLPVECTSDTRQKRVARNLENAVPLIFYASGSQNFLCSGGLMAKADGSKPEPLLLTANHCISTQGEALTVDAFWDYTQPRCNAPNPNLNGLPRSTGSVLLFTSAQSDATLLRLGSVPPDRTYLGFDPFSVANQQGLVLHRVSHPMGNPHHYSRSSVDVNAPTCGGAPRGNFIYHRTNTGGTFGGSSGAPLVTDDLRVVGQLTGACGPPSTNQDGCDYVNNAEVDGAMTSTLNSIAPFLGGNAIAPCQADANTMCLNNDRFRVRVEFDSPVRSGDGTVVDLSNSDDSGIFWFFEPDNWEMLIKVLDGCNPLFDHYWVFFAATTDVEFTLTVTDTQSGMQRQYFNPLNQAADAITDTSAFATCP